MYIAGIYVTVPTGQIQGVKTLLNSEHNVTISEWVGFWIFACMQSAVHLSHITMHIRICKLKQLST